MSDIINQNQDEEELETGSTTEAPTEKKVFHGADAVAKVSENLGRPLTFAEQRVVEEEGYVATPYLDTKGVLTQGVGQTGEWIEKGFEAAFQHHVDRTQQRIPNLQELPDNLQAELIQAEYRGDLGQSPTFLKLFNQGFYNTAAQEFLDHDEYRESKEANSGVHKRMQRVSDAVSMFASGETVKGEAVPEAAPFKTDFNIGTSGFALIDGDTFKNKETGEKYRFDGIDLAETSKLLRDKGFIRGEGGGEVTKSMVSTLFNKYGFTNPVLTDKDAGYERKIGDFVDDKGNSGKDFLIAAGIAKPTFIGKSKETMSEEEYSRYVWNMGERAIRDPKKPKTDIELAAEMIKAAEYAPTNGQFVAKQLAFNEAEFALMPELFSGVVLRNKNATFDNRSKVPYSQSFDNALEMVRNSFFQVASMGLDVAGFDEAEAYMQGRVDYSKSRLKDMPKVRLDYKDVDWTSLDEVSEYLGANLAMSLPFMGVTAAALLTGGLAGAASLVGAAAYSAPVMMYTGLIIDEMPGELEDKSYTAAIAGGAIAASLDVFGLRGALGLIKPSQFMTGEAKDAAIQAVQNAKGESLQRIISVLGKEAGDSATTGVLTRSQAELALSRSSKREIAALSAGVKEKVEQQLRKSVLLKQFTKGLTAGAAFEGSTEMLQELTQYTAVVMGSEKTWNFDELQDRLTNAAIAGGLMGAGFAAPGTVWEAGAWKDASVAMSEYDQRYEEAANSWREEEVELYGKVRDLDEALEAEWYEVSEREGKPLSRDSQALPEDFTDLTQEEQYDIMMQGSAVPQSLEDLADKGSERRSAVPKSDKLADMFKDPVAALRTALDTRMDTELLGKSPSARLIYSMLGGTKNAVQRGLTFTSDKVASYTAFEGALTGGTIDQILNKFTTDSSRYGRKREQVSALLYDFHRSIIMPITKKKGKGNKEHMTGAQVIAAIDWDNLPPAYSANSAALKEVVTDLYAVDDMMWRNITARQEQTSEPLIGKLQDHIFRSKAFLKEKIAADKQRFISLLQSEKGLSKENAEAVTDTILDNPDANSLEDAFDLTRGGLYPAGFKRRSLDIADSKAFDDFLQNNIFDNLEQNMKGSARYMASLKYLGKNNKLMDQLLTKVYNELSAKGDPNAQEIVEDLAMNVRDLVNADSGNYRRIENESIRGAQKFMTVVGVLTMLPLAAPMSLVEFALTPMNVNVQALNKNIGSLGMILGREMFEYFAEVGRMTGLAPKRSTFDTAIKSRKGRIGDDVRYVGIADPRGLLKRIGMLQQKTGQATLVGVSETSEFTKSLMDNFFKIIGLTSVTNATRTLRAAFFNDFLISNLDKIHSAGLVQTNEVVEARQMLEEFGIPVDTMIDLSNKLQADPENKDILAQWERQFDNGLLNFVNGAVPMPSAMTRPLIYSDPHFAMFMQFQGFISQFTAVHIPRMYKTISKATPGMKYSMFASMASMLMLGYAAQYLKDLIKFGKGSPYLSDNEKYLRALYSSGLLGVTERVISNNYLFPLYENRSRGVVESTWNLVAGEAPASNIVENIYGLGKGALEEDTRKTLKSGLSLTPFSPLKHRIYDELVQNNWIIGDK